MDDNNVVDWESLTGLERLRAQREQLKRKGSVMDQYSDQLQERLGRKAKYLGMDLGNKVQTPKRKGKLGSLDLEGESGAQDTDLEILDLDLLDEDDDEDGDYDADADEDAIDQQLVDLVAEKLREKRAKEKLEEEERLRVKLEQLRIDRERSKCPRIPPKCLHPRQG